MIQTPNMWNQSYAPTVTHTTDDGPGGLLRIANQMPGNKAPSKTMPGKRVQCHI